MKRLDDGDLQRPSDPHPLRGHADGVNGAAAEQLIEKARSHHLGTDFLRAGSLDAVAATFRVHAFTVDEARNLLDRK